MFLCLFFLFCLILSLKNSCCTLIFYVKSMKYLYLFICWFTIKFKGYNCLNIINTVLKLCSFSSIKQILYKPLVYSICQEQILKQHRKVISLKNSHYTPNLYFIEGTIKGNIISFRIFIEALSKYILTPLSRSAIRLRSRREFKSIK